MGKRIDLSALVKRADWKSWSLATAHVGFVLAPVYAAAYLGWRWWWVFLWLWCGILMNGMLNLMHECAHFHTFQKKEHSDLWGRWILGPLLLADFDAYRSRHWEHHKHLGEAGDTKDAYLLELSHGRAAVVLLRCLLLTEALHKFGLQVKPGGKKVTGQKHGAVWLGRIVVVQAGFVISLLAIASIPDRPMWPNGVGAAVAAYGLVYLYGVASLTVLMTNLRSIAEHQLENGEGAKQGRAALRNFRCGPVSRLVFGSYGFAEHATHHLEPGIPYYHLPSSTRELALSDASLRPMRGYMGQLFLLTKKRAGSTAR